MSTEASPPPGRSRLATTGRDVRFALGGAILVILIGVIAFRLGAFDSTAKHRTLQLLAPDETTFLGIRYIQNANDMVAYQEIIAATRPDWIIETGTLFGGLTLYMAAIQQQVNPQGRVISVDIAGDRWRQTVAALQGQPEAQLLDRVEFFETSSTDPKLIDEIKRQIEPGQRVMVVLDALHTETHVAEEMRLYGPLVSPGCYMVVNDTALDGTWINEYQPGPMAAVRGYLAEMQDFVVDDSVTEHRLTGHPSGYLRKVPPKAK